VRLDEDRFKNGSLTVQAQNNRFVPLIEQFAGEQNEADMA